MRVLLLTASLSSLLFGPVGCAASAAEVRAKEAVSARSYYPLAVGNRWVFRVKPAAPDGKDLEVRIVDRDAEGFFVSDAGTRLVARSQGIFDGARFLIEEPLEAGHKWLAVPSASTVERYRIVDTAAMVRVPAGSFTRCLQVETEQPIRAQDGRSGRLVGTWSYAPGVGPVHFIQRVELAGVPPAVNAEFSLVEFELVAGGDKAPEA